MNNYIFFDNSDLVFTILGEPKTKEQLSTMFPFEFYGKNDFIEFYQIHNGVFFPDGAEMSRSKFYGVGDDDYDELEVECFYDIGGRLEKMWNATKNISPEAVVYSETHIPFASDAAGNEFWIEISSGQIKYVSWEYGLPDGEVLAAPTFKDFCLAIRPLE